MAEAGLHIYSGLSTVWMPWVCLAMVILLWLSCIMQPRYLRGLLSNSFGSFTVNAAEQAPSIGSQIAQWLSNCTVPAICIYTLAVQEAMHGTELFGMILLLSLLTDVFRTITALLLHYTFRYGKQTSLAYMRYFSLRSLFTYAEFAFVLLLMYTTPQLPWLIVLGLLTVVYMTILGLQWARLFCSSVLDVVSLLIYLLTVELLPTALLFEASKQLYFLQPA